VETGTSQRAAFDRRQALFRAGRVLGAISKGVAILLLGAILTEIAFRVLHRFSPRFIFPAATYNQLRPKPFSVIGGLPLNSHGFRDVEHEEAKPPGTFRILGIGDSFAFGVVPYPHNYLILLEQDLDAGGAAGYRAVEVINMGIPRIGVADYFSLLVNEGLRLDPDFVLLCFYIGNDFRLRRQAGKEPSSYLLAFLRYLFRVFPEYADWTGEKREYDDLRPTFSKEAYLRVLQNRVAQFRKKDAQIHENFPKVVSYLENIRRVCEARGVKLFVAIFPDEMQVDPEVRRQLFESMPGDKPEDYDFSLPDAVLIEELERQGIGYVDLLPALRIEGQQAPVYKPRDTHLNLRGNRVVADRIGEALRSGGWLGYHSGDEQRE